MNNKVLKYIVVITLVIIVAVICIFCTRDTKVPEATEPTLEEHLDDFSFVEELKGENIHEHLPEYLVDLDFMDLQFPATDVVKYYPAVLTYLAMEYVEIPELVLAEHVAPPVYERIMNLRLHGYGHGDTLAYDFYLETFPFESLVVEELIVDKLLRVNVLAGYEGELYLVLIDGKLCDLHTASLYGYDLEDVNNLLYPKDTVSDLGELSYEK